VRLFGSAAAGCIALVAGGSEFRSTLSVTAFDDAALLFIYGGSLLALIL